MDRITRTITETQQEFARRLLTVADEATEPRVVKQLVREAKKAGDKVTVRNLQARVKELERQVKQEQKRAKKAEKRAREAEEKTKKHTIYTPPTVSKKSHTTTTTDEYEADLRKRYESCGVDYDKYRHGCTSKGYRHRIENPSIVPD